MQFKNEILQSQIKFERLFTKCVVSLDMELLFRIAFIFENPLLQLVLFNCGVFQV